MTILALFSVRRFARMVKRGKLVNYRIKIVRTPAVRCYQTDAHKLFRSKIQNKGILDE